MTDLQRQHKAEIDRVCLRLATRETRVQVARLMRERPSTKARVH